jgi:hypothetical protein
LFTQSPLCPKPKMSPNPTFWENGIIIVDIR